MILEIEVLQRSFAKGQENQIKELYVFECEIFRMNESKITIRRNPHTSMIFYRSLRNNRWFLDRLDLADDIFRLDVEKDLGTRLLKLSLNGNVIFEDSDN